MLDRIRAGDELALGQLLREEWPGPVRHLATMADSADAARDAAQEAFIRLRIVLDLLYPHLTAIGIGQYRSITAETEDR